MCIYLSVRNALPMIPLSQVKVSYRRFNAIVPQLKMHYFSEGAFESLIASSIVLMSMLRHGLALLAQGSCERFYFIS